jgi:hypothetical protein
MSNNKQTPIDYLLSHVWTTDWVNYTYDEKLEVFEEARKMHNKEMQEQYQDGRESVIIEHLAVLSTSNASSYSDGYKEGYNRAIELTKWTITNLIPPHNEQR